MYNTWESIYLKVYKPITLLFISDSLLHWLKISGAFYCAWASEEESIQWL